MNVGVKVDMAAIVLCARRVLTTAVAIHVYITFPKYMLTPDGLNICSHRMVFNHVIELFFIQCKLDVTGRECESRDWN